VHRALSQLLLVLSDDDLHVKGAPFNTGGARAIATSLNALVYHTHFPKQQQQQQQQPSMQRQGSTRVATTDTGTTPLPATTLRCGAALLERYAPQALRGLYERDQRRSFCQAALWTAPFDGDSTQPAAAASSSSSGAQGRELHTGLRSVAAVVQGLLFGGGTAASSSSGDAASNQQQVASLSLAPVSGSPSAMTALLHVAPQCVPFDVRLQLFRSVFLLDGWLGGL